MSRLDRYSVRLTFNASDPKGREGTGAYLAHRGRTEWTRKTAERLARECRVDTRFTMHYSLIEVVPA